MKVVVLGSKGSLGQEIIRAFGKYDLVSFDRENLDVTDEDKVYKILFGLNPNLVINCTAYNGVDKAEDELIVAEEINGSAVGYMAETCKALNAVLVHYSTGMVFKGDKSEGHDEDDLTDPINSYGRSKLAGEMEVQKNTENFYIIRTSWLFGKPGLGASAKKSFVDIMLEQAEDGKQVKVVDDEFGSPTYVKDLADATLKLVEAKKEFGIYHLTNSGVTSRYEFAAEIFRIKDLDVKLTPIHSGDLARKAKRPKYEILINKKFDQLRPWSEALKDYLQ